LPVVIGLAGKRGSGKSTIARRLAKEHGFVHASFGDAVRREAVARALSTDTPTLQSLGRALIDEWGWIRFCQAVMDSIPESPRIVIDGIRHADAVKTLRHLVAPSRFELVFVQLAHEMRLERIRDRGRIGDSDAIVDSDPVELEVESLHALAAFEVDGNDDKAAALISRWCQRIS
jgi:adenylate kinase family enzyme